MSNLKNLCFEDVQKMKGSKSIFLSSVLSSPSFSCPFKRDRDSLSVTLSSPVADNNPASTGGSGSADGGGVAAGGFGAIGPPCRRSSVPASNSYSECVC